MHPIPIICLTLDEREARQHVEKEVVVNEYVLGHTAANREQSFSDSYVKMLRVAKEWLEANPDLEHILLIEDDFKAMPGFSMAKVNDLTTEAPAGFALLYLGGNVTDKYNKRVSHNVFEAQGVWTTHAVLWSRWAVEFVLGKYSYRETRVVFDEWLRSYFQPFNRCYICKPFLAIQRPRYSEIQKKYIDYTDIFQASENRLN